MLDDLKCRIDTRGLGNVFHSLILPLISYNISSTAWRQKSIDFVTVSDSLSVSPPVEADFSTVRRTRVYICR
jgi:hypothetical protein